MSYDCATTIRPGRQSETLYTSAQSIGDLVHVAGWVVNGQHEVGNGSHGNARDCPRKNPQARSQSLSTEEPLRPKEAAERLGPAAEEPLRRGSRAAGA